ncbi:MAG: hypothetical protein KID04_04335 [Clostridium sp.]|nr:hypothetical protein [Clostridium sp.]
MIKRKNEALFWTAQSILGEPTAFPAVGQLDADKMIGIYRSKISEGFCYYAIDLETGVSFAQGSNWKDLKMSINENWDKLKTFRAGKDYSVLKTKFAEQVAEAVTMENQVLNAIDEGRKKT